MVLSSERVAADVTLYLTTLTFVSWLIEMTHIVLILLTRNFGFAGLGPGSLIALHLGAIKFYCIRVKTRVSD